MIAAAFMTLLVAAAAPRAAPDPDAIRDAVEGREGHEPYASARAYLHYLQARLAEQEGDLHTAMEELKRALVYDDRSADLHTSLGWLHARMNELDLAGLEARAALAADGRDAEAQLLLGKVLVAQHRNEEAVRALERAIQLAPEDAEPYLTLVRLHAAEGELGKGDAVAERLFKVRPAEAEGCRILARAAADRGASAVQEHYLRAAFDRDGWDFESANQLASLLLARGDLDGATRLYERVLHKDPDDANALLGAAQMSLRRGDAPSARAYFGKLLSTSEGGEVRLRAALTFLAARRTGEALQLLDEAAKADPADRRVSYYRGVVLEADRRFAEAAEAYATVPATIRDLYASAQARAASCLSLSGKPSAAVAAMQRAMAAVLGERGDAQDEVISTVPDVFRRAGRAAEGEKLLATARARADGVELRLALARSLEDEGRTTEAVQLLLAAVADNPDEDRLLLALAAAEEKAGRWQEAVDRARKLLHREPDSPQALNFIGYTWADHGVRLDEARALIARALKLRPDEGYYLDSLGWCELGRGNVTAAVEALERADARSPGEPVILHHLAEAYLRAGRSGDAISAWTRALKLLEADPDPEVRPRVEAGLKRARGGSASR